jgi:NAD-dependent dihydropyrimidine dehydrogenase PreA subunit
LVRCENCDALIVDPNRCKNCGHPVEVAPTDEARYKHNLWKRRGVLLEEARADRDKAREALRGVRELCEKRIEEQENEVPGPWPWREVLTLLDSLSDSEGTDG